MSPVYPLQNENHLHAFPIPAEKMFAHTYVIWPARLSSLRLGPWDGAGDFILYS